MQKRQARWSAKGSSELRSSSTSRFTQEQAAMSSPTRPRLRCRDGGTRCPTAVMGEAPSMRWSTPSQACRYALDLQKRRRISKPKQLEGKSTCTTRALILCKESFKHPVKLAINTNTVETSTTAPAATTTTTTATTTTASASASATASATATTATTFTTNTRTTLLISMLMLILTRIILLIPNQY